MVIKNFFYQNVDKGKLFRTIFSFGFKFSYYHFENIFQKKKILTPIGKIF